MVNRGQKESDARNPNINKQRPTKDTHSRHSQSSKNIQSEIKSQVSGISVPRRRFNEAKKQRSQPKPPQRKVNDQQKNVKPLTLRTIQTLHGDEIDSIEEYDDDYDYSYYDDIPIHHQTNNARESSNNDPTSRLQAQISKDRENEALRAHRLVSLLFYHRFYFLCGSKRLLFVD